MTAWTTDIMKRVYCNVDPVGGGLNLLFAGSLPTQGLEQPNMLG